MIRSLMITTACAAILMMTPIAYAQNKFGTAAEAKAMLEKTVAAVKADMLLVGPVPATPSRFPRPIPHSATNRLVPFAALHRAACLTKRHSVALEQTPILKERSEAVLLVSQLTEPVTSDWPASRRATERQLENR